MKLPHWLTGVSLTLIVTLCGCTHDFEWVNRQDYRSLAIDTSREGLLVSLENTTPTEQSELLCLQVAQALSTRGGYRVRYLATGNATSGLRLKIAIAEDYSGRLSNFLITFPGYLVFTPAWLGNGYTVDHTVTCTIEDGHTGESIDTIQVPITLEFRYTDDGRGWANCVIWPATPFVLFNALYSMTYDDDITDMLNDTAYKTLGEYIAEKLIARINTEPDATPAPDAP